MGNNSQKLLIDCIEAKIGKNRNKKNQSKSVKKKGSSCGFMFQSLDPVNWKCMGMKCNVIVRTNADGDISSDKNNYYQNHYQRWVYQIIIFLKFSTFCFVDILAWKILSWRGKVKVVLGTEKEWFCWTTSDSDIMERMMKIVKILKVLFLIPLLALLNLLFIWYQNILRWWGRGMWRDLDMWR